MFTSKIRLRQRFLYMTIYILKGELLSTNALYFSWKANLSLRSFLNLYELFQGIERSKVFSVGFLQMFLFNIQHRDVSNKHFELIYSGISTSYKTCTLFRSVNDLKVQKMTRNKNFEYCLTRSPTVY